MEKLSLGRIRRLSHFLLDELVAPFLNAVRAMLGETNSVSVTERPSKAPCEACLNYEVRALASRRMHEIETQKAMAILESRHEKWKGAGGPL